MAKKRISKESGLVETAQEENEPSLDEINEAFEDLSSTSEEE